MTITWHALAVLPHGQTESPGGNSPKLLPDQEVLPLGEHHTHQSSECIATPTHDQSWRGLCFFLAGLSFSPPTERASLWASQWPGQPQQWGGELAADTRGDLVSVSYDIVLWFILFAGDNVLFLLFCCVHRNMQWPCVLENAWLSVCLNYYTCFDWKLFLDSTFADLYSFNKGVTVYAWTDTHQHHEGA